MKNTLDDVLWKHLPPSVQEFRSSKRNVLYPLENIELLLKIEVANLDEDMFNNSRRDCTKCFHSLSSNRYYVAATANWGKENIFVKICTVYAFYVQAEEPAEVIERVTSRPFRGMIASMYEAEKKEENCHNSYSY